MLKSICTAAAAALFAAAAQGQSPEEVRGRVVSADAVEPIAGAVVQVLGTEIETTTGADGEFRVVLPSPSDRILVVTHLGHAADTVRLPAGDAGPLTVRLMPAPIRLRGVAARGAPSRGTFTVTRETVRQIPPLGEPDLLRAVVLHPSASQPNDLKGRIHLDGGASDETGLRLDGHPLHDPFHLLGLLSAFPLNVLERADVHTHHLPAERGGFLSGIIDMQTALPGAEPLHEVTASVGTATAAMLRPGPFGTDILASGRITYLDRLADMVKLDSDFPRYGFRDGLLRIGRSAGEWRAELLAFGTRDRFSEPDLEELGRYEPLTWGESLLGVRLSWRGTRWSAGLRGSFGRGRTTLDETDVGRANRVDMQRDWWSGSARAAYVSRTVRASGGIDFDQRRNRNDWSGPGLVDEILSPGVPGSFSAIDTLEVLAPWAEVAWRASDRIRISAGARASRAVGDWFIAPRVELTGQFFGGLTARIAANRRFQFNAMVEEPVEGSASPPVFFLDAPRRVDVLGVAFEKALALGRRTSLTVYAEGYAKRYAERPLLPAADIGPADTAAFPDFERITGRAFGASARVRLELSAGPLVEASYGYQRVRETFDGATTPTTWDIPHSLTVLLSVPAGDAWTFNGVFQARTGRATTPLALRIFAPRLADGPTPSVPSRHILGERNSIRVPSYRRLDVGVRRRWRGAIDWTVSLQVLNVLGAANALDYDWLQYALSRTSGFSGGTRTGLPFLPTIGLEARW